MPRDAGAISLLLLAAVMLVGILGISERALSHDAPLELRYAEWREAAE